MNIMVCKFFEMNLRQYTMLTSPLTMTVRTHSVEMVLRVITPEKVFESSFLSFLLMATSRMPTVPTPIMAKSMK